MLLDKPSAWRANDGKVHLEWQQVGYESDEDAEQNSGARQHLRHYYILAFSFLVTAGQRIRRPAILAPGPVRRSESAHIGQNAYLQGFLEMSS